MPCSTNWAREVTGGLCVPQQPRCEWVNKGGFFSFWLLAYLNSEPFGRTDVRVKINKLSSCWKTVQESLQTRCCAEYVLPPVSVALRTWARVGRQFGVGCVPVGKHHWPVRIPQRHYGHERAPQRSVLLEFEFPKNPSNVTKAQDIPGTGMCRHAVTVATPPGKQEWGGETTGLRKRGNNTSKSTGRSSRQDAATRRNMRRAERVTVQGPVKEQQPDGISHGGGTPPPPPQDQSEHLVKN